MVFQKVAIVTGAGRGIGAADAIQLSREGVRVVVNDIDGGAADEIARKIVGRGGTALSVEADVSEESDVRMLVAKTIEAFGGIDIVVSNAGGIHSGTSLEQTDDREWQRSFEVHVGGAVKVIRASLPYLVASNNGRVVVVSSMWAQTPPGHSYGYVCAKGALLAFARNLAIELAPFGICVNAITPGEVRTRMNAAKTPEDEERDKAKIPLGRWAEPDEVAKLVGFLCSDGSNYITGQTIAINGGEVIAGF